MSISAVAAGGSQPVQVQTHAQPVVQSHTQKTETDEVQISSTAKQLHAKATHSDRDHDDD